VKEARGGSNQRKGVTSKEKGGQWKREQSEEREYRE
jgi:hypothetical protein